MTAETVKEINTGHKGDLARHPVRMASMKTLEQAADVDEAMFDNTMISNQDYMAAFYGPVAQAESESHLRLTNADAEPVSGSVP